jgi:large subunit ribosomal protein L24
MFTIKKNDIVTVLSGKDKGKTGKVLRIIPKKKKLIVEGINMMTKHVKPRSQDKQTAGLIKTESGVIASKVMLVCPRCNKPTKVSFKRQHDNTKARICKKCSEVIS